MNKACIPANIQVRIAYVAHLIRHISFTNKAVQNGNVRLYSKAMESILTSRIWSHAKTWLASEGFLEYDKKDYVSAAVAGTKAKCIPYRLTSKLPVTGWELRQIANKAFEKRLEWAKSQQGTVSEYAATVAAKQLEVMDRLIIDNDAYAAIDTANLTPETHKKVLVDGKWVKRRITTDADKAESIEVKREHHRHLVNEIQLGNHFAKVDMKVGRLHSLFTQLPRYLRKYVKYCLKGEVYDLAEYDVTNCQLSLLASELRKVYGLAVESDVYRFYCLCRDGGMYEHLMSVTGCTDRDQMKVDVFTYLLFGRNINFDRWKYAKAFTQEFPTVAAFIRQTKQENHNAMALLLQRRESDMFIGTRNSIMARLMAAHIDAITIHDCVVFPAIMAEMVKPHLTSALIEHSVPAKIKLKQWV